MAKTRRRSGAKKKDKQQMWIQEATQRMLKKGTAGSYTKSILRRYGKAGFDSKGRIKCSVIRKDLKHKNEKIRKRARFVMSVRKDCRKD